MSERPWFRVTPAIVGFYISYGENPGPDGPKGGLPLKLERGSWRPTRRSAQARGRRYLRRVEAQQSRERRSCLVEGSE